MSQSVERLLNFRVLSTTYCKHLHVSFKEFDVLVAEFLKDGLRSKDVMRGDEVPCFDTMRVEEENALYSQQARGMEGVAFGLEWEEDSHLDGSEWCTYEMQL